VSAWRPHADDCDEVTEVYGDNTYTYTYSEQLVVACDGYVSYVCHRRRVTVHKPVS